MPGNRNYCLSTVVYPGVEKNIQGFLSSARAMDEDVRCIVFNHGANIEALPLTKTVPVDSSLSIASVRAFMFSYLKKFIDADIYMFTDSDDKVHPQAIQRHAAALMNADFSYGDQSLYINDFSNGLNKTLFEIMNPPQTLELVKDLLKGNCVGLSALAMNRKCLEAVPENFPENVPLLDWWLSLNILSLGFKGARAEVVTDYCLSQNAYDRIGSAKTLEELKVRIDVVERVLKNVDMNNDVSVSLQRIDALKAMISSNSALIDKAMKEVSEKNLMWYQDVFEISREL